MVNKYITLQLNDLINKLTNIKQIIEKSDSNPEIYLKEKLFDDIIEAKYVLDNLFYNYGKNELDSFQNDYIQKVYKCLESFLSDVILDIEEGEDGFKYIIVSIEFLEDIIPIINIYPMFHTFEILEISNISELKEKEYQLNLTLEEISNRMDLVKKAYDNPAIYTGENLKLFTKLAFNKTQRTKILNEELNNLTNDYNYYNNELLNIRDEIINVENTFTSISISKNRYISRLKNRFGFVSINPMTEKEEDDNISFSIKEENEGNKEFFSKMFN